MAAFTTWGLVPVYWKLLKQIPAPEILAHRIVWTIVFLATLLSWQRRWPEVQTNFHAPRPAFFCLSSGIMVARLGAREMEAAGRGELQFLRWEARRIRAEAGRRATISR